VTAPAANRIVVLDDDPLGGQCVRDVPVLTTWSPDALAEELQRSPAFLLLTDTRALPRAAAIERAREIGLALRAAWEATGLPVTPVWRTDSTLRGHFWWEMRAFDAAFSEGSAPEPAYVFIPYFGEAGRVTKDDTQLVEQDGRLVPIAETEFARDPSFGFTHSRLPDWLEAHSSGHFPATATRSLPHESLEDPGLEQATRILAGTPAGGTVIINATADSHVEAFVAALAAAETGGRRFLCTGAAPFVRARLGQPVHDLLTPAALHLGSRSPQGRESGSPSPRRERGLGGEVSPGGLTIVGSYIERTTAQLERALAGGDVCAFELPVGPADIPGLAAAVSKRLADGEDVIVHTSRRHTPADAPAIAEALAELVSRLDTRPRYLLVKGGSTASHFATGALGVRRALVLGRLLAGVPVWRLGDESRWPGLPLVIFPGNVGGPESLAEALRLLRGPLQDEIPQLPMRGG
jgi:uncharacterized protein YgbK (DUF1537 family)